MRGQHHAGTRNASGHAGAIVGSIVLGLLILLAVGMFVAMG